MKTVRITVEGGVIQYVDCPRGVRVIVQGLRHRWLRRTTSRTRMGTTTSKVSGSTAMPTYEIEQYEIHVQTYGSSGQRSRGHCQAS